MSAQPTSDDFSYTDPHGDPVAVDLLLHSDVPLEALDDGEDVPELRQALDGDESDDDHSQSSSDSAVYSPSMRKAVSQAYPNSIYSKLVEYGLLRKVTDIVLAKVKIPWNLRDDAAQAVHFKWCTIPAKGEYQKSQLAFYAYKSGQHAALAERRMLGAVCVLPGALFREGKKSTFMETIGAAVNPMDVDEYKDSMELAVDANDMMHLAVVSEDLMRARLGGLALSAKQLRVARMVLVERKDVVEISMELGMRPVYIERLLKQVTAKLNNLDAGTPEPEAVKPKRVAKPASPTKKTDKPAERNERVKAPLGSTPKLRPRKPTTPRAAAQGTLL